MSTQVTPMKTRSGFSPDASHSYTLPAPYYYDPTIFEREKEAIWFRSWQWVGSLADLQKPGSYITTKIVDQPVFVVRTKAGELKAYYNACQHRGHLLLEKPKGSRAVITCPFHAWTYTLDGNLRSAPNAENVPYFDHAEFKLSEVRVEAWGLWVFVNLDPDAKPLAELADGLLDEMHAAIPKFDDLKFVRKDSFDLAANWKFILDGLECYHCPYIHPQIMGSKNGYTTQSFDGHERDWYSTHINRGNYELMENNPEKLPYDFGSMAIKDIFIWYLWPNIVFVAHQGSSNIKVLQAKAEGPERASRHFHNYCLNDPPTEQDLAHMNQYRDISWPQDRKAMELQAQGVRARGYRQGRLMVDREHSWRSEHGTHHFQNLVWRALNGTEY